MVQRSSRRGEETTIHKAVAIFLHPFHPARSSLICWPREEKRRETVCLSVRQESYPSKRRPGRQERKPSKQSKRTKMREIVFFDVETTAPSSEGRWWLLEFGAILVCPKKLVEVGSYETLIRPGDLSAVSRRFNTDVEAIRSAPAFKEVADKIYDILEGRVWAGHNIQRFDCPRIREAFAEIGRTAPEPAGVVDSLNVLAHDFGRRAGDLKMATLASYFGIGKQKHRSLDDARMNLEVLKHCATVLLLESSLPPHLLSAAARDGGRAMTTRRMTAATSTSTSSLTPPKNNRMLQTKLPFITTPAPAEAATQKISRPCKRDNLGKVVGKASNKEASLGTRRAATTTPFHMILRHSRAILR